MTTLPLLSSKRRATEKELKIYKNNSDHLTIKKERYSKCQTYTQNESVHVIYSKHRTKYALNYPSNWINSIQIFNKVTLNKELLKKKYGSFEK